MTNFEKFSKIFSIDDLEKLVDIICFDVFKDSIEEWENYCEHKNIKTNLCRYNSCKKCCEEWLKMDCNTNNS